MKYNWQQKDWPIFRYDEGKLEDTLYRIAAYMGRLSGAMKMLPENTKMDMLIDTMVSEAIKTSEIEGEFFSRQDVKSSIRNKLGLNTKPEHVHNKSARGVGELMVAVHTHFAEPLSEEMLFDWHRLLLPESRGIAVGEWRTHEEPMQVLSGAFGKERVHFEAPASKNVPEEMSQFIRWFNETAPGGKREIKKAPIRAGIAHLYFESIHPFEDGNGRIGRALSEMALAQGIGHLVLMSLSATIEANKKDYYSVLEKAQYQNEITPWLNYFSDTIHKAQQAAEDHIDFILGKANFFDTYKEQLNPRQQTAINRMLEEGPNGFEGGMSARKYIAITKTSKATATRDLQHLVEIGAFKPIGAGRSARYDICDLPVRHSSMEQSGIERRWMI